MSASTILWVYIVLLMAGGLMGFIKAGSKASLIASTIFSVILVLFQFGVFPFKYHVAVLSFLALFFGIRFAKAKKFMPNGLMSILTLVTLVCSYLFTKH